MTGEERRGEETNDMNEMNAMNEKNEKRGEERRGVEIDSEKEQFSSLFPSRHPLSDQSTSVVCN